MATQSDDIARLTEILVLEHVQMGLANRLTTVLQMRDQLGHVAKACGVTVEQLDSWRHGWTKPTTQQGLAWLLALYELQGRTPQMGLGQADHPAGHVSSANGAG